MVTNGIELGKYGDLLEEIQKEEKKEEKSSRTVELFFSFDIVNSSSYKDVNFFGWQEVLTTLLTSIQKDIAREIPEAQLWRVLGDEIVFFVTIREIDEIYTSIDSLYDVLMKSNQVLKSGKFFDGLKNRFTQTDINLMKNNNILAVQSAVWLAIVWNGTQGEFQMYDNIFKVYRNNDGQQINEFLGQDIDIGFRIKKETQDRRLAVSVELAKLLSERTEYLSHLYIITYKSLKGVWKNRLYPIIWYHDEKVSKVSFEDSFYYDETSYSQLSKEYFLNRENEEGNLASYMFNDVHKALNKVLKDQKLESKIDQICAIIKETGNDVKNVEKEFDSKLLEFHCAAVCCDLKNRTILIVKRKNRRQLSGLWEFGCAKANIYQELCETIVADYNRYFGIDIEVICDKEREDSQPKPIALYQVAKGNGTKKLQKGVIVIAKVMGNEDKIAEVIEKSGRHEIHRWISEEEIEQFNEQAIDDFKDTLKKVFSIWDEIFKEN